jgi:hypothetical protein
MAIIPLRQSITITPAMPGGLTEFDTPEMGQPAKKKCRYQETITLVSSMVDGQQVVSKATIFFDGFEAIDEHTKLEYTREDGATLIHTPLSVAVKRHINGKALLTVVYVEVAQWQADLPLNLTPIKL